MIIGFTDKPIIRRDGKIRSGYKEGSKLINTDYFLLHDAPGLAASLEDEKPKEIYFTVHSDDLSEVLKDDLRWYTANELVCKSMHNAPDNDNKPMGPVAAFFQNGETEGVSQMQFPRMSRARVRLCKYTACPQYQQGNCSEHMFLDIMVPQHSMGSMFTFDNTSMKGLQNAYSVFNKAKIRYGGKLAGQVFRAYKADDQGSYVGKDGKTKKTDIKVLQFEVVDFGWYEANYKSKIKEDDWNSLLALRSQLSIGLTGLRIAAPSNDDAMALSAPAQTLAAPAAIDPEAQARADFEAVKARANDPAAAAVFEEIAKLTGRENNEDVRIATAKNFPEVGGMVTYLQNKIKEIKKKAATSPQTEQKQPAQATEQQQGKQQAQATEQKTAQTTQPGNQQETTKSQAKPPGQQQAAKPVNGEILF